jgi:integrase/recombinase XerD
MTKQHSAASGVLANYLPGFREELTRLGYPDVRADCHLALLADLSRWLEDTGLDPGALTAEVVEQFLTVRREQGHRDLITLIGARPLLDYLIGLGVIRPLARRVPDGPATALLEGYRDYLTYERGLAPHGVERYEQLAQRFVRSVEVDGGIDWAGVSAAEVTRFVVATCSGPGRGSARNLLPALRSFLRFAFLDGWISLPLAQAVPAIAGWRASPLPKGLSRDEVAKLLNSCDRDSARGRRDFAILTLLARLGLRGGEVAIMGLDDIDWRAGEFTVHGKGRRDERLPLPSDVGEAIADYLRLGRPPAVPHGVPAAVRTAAGADHAGGDLGGLPSVSAGRSCSGGGAPPAPRCCQRDAPLWCQPRRGRRNPSASGAANHGDLRQGRPCLPDRARPTVAGRCGMTELRSALEDYIGVRRHLGHKLEVAEHLLGQFLDFLEGSGATVITTQLALSWATLPGGASPGWLSQRLSVVRGFAAFLQTLDPRTQIPPSAILTGRPSRAVPYLYTDAEVVAIMAAARRLPSRLPSHTYPTLVGLLAVTGLRVGEAIRLDRGDVCFDDALVRVIETKFGKSREVPLSASTVQALRRYGQQRDALIPAPKHESFFLSTTGTRLTYARVRVTFAELAHTAGLAPRSQRCRPRMHDLRH